MWDFTKENSLVDQRLCPGETGNAGMRFRIPGIKFREHAKLIWMGSQDTVSLGSVKRVGRALEENG